MAMSMLDPMSAPRIPPTRFVVGLKTCFWSADAIRPGARLTGRASR
jgi:hypothetical protein